MTTPIRQSIATNTESTTNESRNEGHIRVELLNVQSLLPKLPDIRADIQQRNPDIVCFTETNLKTKTPNRLITIPGYRFFRVDRKLGRKQSGGGVAVYVNEKVNAEQLTIPSSLGPQSHVEALWLKAKLDRKKAVLVGCLYRPPTANNAQIQADFNDIEEQLQNIIASHPSQRIIIAGDLNADHLTNPSAHARLVELERYGLQCVVDHPTFYRGVTQSVLDVVLLSHALCSDLSPPTCTVEVSDYSCHHRRVIVETKIPRSKPVPVYKTSRNWRTFNGIAFNNDVAATDWHTSLQGSCEQQWETFVSTLTNILDKHAPNRRFRVHNPSPPPVTHETLVLMRRRKEARENNAQSYKRINAITKRAIRKDCRDNIDRQLTESSPSALYRVIQPVIARKGGNPTQPLNLTPDQLNEYFTSIGTETRHRVATEYEQSGREPLKVRLPRVNAGALRITPVTLDQLKRVLFSMPNKNSSIEGDIPVKILKLCFDRIGRFLLRIINLSFANETVPSSWKSAVVIPIHKRNDPSKASNFRPVTTVPVICKIVEKLVHMQLTSYLNQQNLFNDDQHGFREQHSTSTALLTVTDEILKGMDRSEITLLTLIDLSRCFDVIDHEALLTKLELLQISTGWFRSYLSGHTQRVRIGEKMSKSLPITIGTFQGTCLGPLLFNIISNDLTCHIPTELDGFRITVVRYADDTQVAITGPRGRIAAMQHCLEGILDTMCTWFQQHGMMVNADKTELLLCGDRRQIANLTQLPSITFMGETLKCTDKVKNLGVTMDSNLSWKYHIKNLTGKCLGMLLGLLHAKHSLPLSLLPRLIDSLVMSHVRYCIQVYGSANSCVLSELQKVINFAARVISGRRKYDHISDVVRQLEWLTIPELVAYNDVCLLHKIITNETPSSLRRNISFNYELLARETRQSSQISLYHPNNNHGKRQFMYRACAKYNQHVIPYDIDAISMDVFKSRVRQRIRNS